jgi:hypothetical protein
MSQRRRYHGDRGAWAVANGDGTSDAIYLRIIRHAEIGVHHDSSRSIVGHRQTSQHGMSADARRPYRQTNGQRLPISRLDTAGLDAADPCAGSYLDALAAEAGVSALGVTSESEAPATPGGSRRGWMMWRDSTSEEATWGSSGVHSSSWCR